MKVYTMEQWEIDGTMSAEPLQEVDKAIYWEMLECLPPMGLPTETAKRLEGINGGFLVGEPYGFNDLGMTYDAYGKTEDGRYYYLGVSNTSKALNCSSVSWF